MRHRCPICHHRLSDSRCHAHPDAHQDAAPQAGPITAPAPPRIAGLEIEDFIGRGGFAWVFRARQGTRVVAVKLAANRTDARAGREIAALEAVGPPAAPALLGSGHTGDRRPFVIMEYLGTDSLARRMARPHGDLATVAAELRGLARALDQVHARGVVHRDLKPENVLFRGPDQACIIDFGLALLDRRHRAAGPRITRAGQWLGSYEYMAPEQWRDDDVDWRADLYALGVIAFERITGRPPFVGDAAAVRQAQVWNQCPRASDLADVPAAVDAVLLRSLEKDRDQRFQSATAMAEALAKTLARTPGEAPEPNARSQATPARRDRPRLMALVLTRARSPTPELLGLAQGHDAVLACADSRGHVFAMPWAGSVAAGVRAAVALAERASGAPAVVHVAELRTRRRGRGLTVLGPALQDLESWTAAAPGQGVVVTAAAGQYLDDQELLDPGTHFARVRPTAPMVGELDTPGLRGRDDLVAHVVAELEQAGRGQAVLATVLGESGMGKSRVLDAVAAALRPRTRVIRAAAGQASERLMATVDAPTAAGESRDTRRRTLLEALLRLARTGPLALLVDDADRADHAVLDAIEEITARRCAVAVCVTARPTLLEARPRWGERAPVRSRRMLEPLDARSSHALIRELLRPAELVPVPVLARVHALAGGIPRYLIEIARALRRGGAIRQVRGMPGYYLAADQIARLVETLPGERLAGRALDSLPATLVPLAELCAVLGQGFTHDDVRAVVAALREQSGNDREPALATLMELDVNAGLSRLRGLGFLVREQGRHAVVPPILGHAVARTMPGSRRLRLHAACLDAWRARGSNSAPGFGDRGDPGAGDDFVRDDLGHRIAFHAAGCGHAGLAARAQLRLAERTRAEHRYIDAEQAFTAALEHMSASHPERASALAGRGSVRYRLQRFDDALADLRRARALVEARGHEVGRAELLLEEAKVLHWCQDAAGSARVARTALAAIDALGEDAQVQRLRAGADLARGRMHYERQELDQAIALLGRAADSAGAASDHDTRAGALLLLAPALVYRGRLEQAEARFDEVESLCRHTGDEFYLATTYLNRAGLWIRRGAADRARVDLYACIDAAEALGNGQLERAATFNLAELLYWQGDLERARAVAERSRALVMQFLSEYRPHEDHLLLGRVLCAQGDPGARRYLEWVETFCDINNLPPSAKTLIEMVTLALRALTGRDVDPAAWHTLAGAARNSALLEEHVEVLAVAAQVFAARGLIGEARKWLERARQAASSLWQPRLRALATTLG